MLTQRDPFRVALIIGVDELLGKAIQKFYEAGICNVAPLGGVSL